MNKEQVYSAWAPEGSVWSKWVKPVLFAYITANTRVLADSQPDELGMSVPAASSDTGVVIDLDGPRGVFLGMRMARKGYCPVPLYNACPRESLSSFEDEPPRSGLEMDSEDSSPQRNPPVVDVDPIVSAIAGAADELRDLKVPESAPPAFLLDRRRSGSGKKVSLGMFDNRSVIFPSDFPSAAFLKERGIVQMVVISETPVPEFDLTAVLREWVAGGLDIKSQVPEPLWAPQAISLPAPSWLQKAWFWLYSHIGLQRDSSGGYGRVRHGSG